MSLSMLDLGSGLGGASQAMVDRGWKVTRIDIEPAFRPSIVADYRALPLRPEYRPDLVWASPVCTEFARESMPWCKTGKDPSLDLVLAAKAAIDAIKPRWWVIENVRGARAFFEPYLGRPTLRIGAAYLWGRFPLVMGVKVNPHKERLGPSPDRRALRSKIPYAISLALAEACERQNAVEASA